MVTWVILMFAVGSGVLIGIVLSALAALLRSGEDRYEHSKMFGWFFVGFILGAVTVGYFVYSLAEASQH